MKMDEYVPLRIPTINGSANSLIDATPSRYNTNTMTNVVMDVLMDLEIVWLILISTN